MPPALSGFMLSPPRRTVSVHCSRLTPRPDDVPEAGRGQTASGLQPFAAAFEGCFPLEARAAKHLSSYDGRQFTATTI
jgi:hypothetical protein